MRVLVLLIVLVSTMCAQSGRFSLDDVLFRGFGEAVLSPDGKTFAMTRDGQIVLIPSDGGWPATLTISDGEKSNLNWSHDGRMIAFVSRGSIWFVSANGGPPRQLTFGPVDTQPRWSPNGRWLLYQALRFGSRNLAVLSTDGKVNTYVAPVGGNAAVESPSWSPDGRHILYVEVTAEHISGVLKVLDFDPLSGRTGEPRMIYTAATDPSAWWHIQNPQWSPDGRNIAVVLQDSGWDNLYLVPIDGARPKRLTEGSWDDSSPRFSPDGTSVAVVSNRGKPEELHIWIVPVGGGAATPLRKSSPAGLEWEPSWSPDGSRMYFLCASPQSGRELAEAQLKGASRTLTHSTPLNLSSGLVQPEVVHYSSKDGTNIAAMLFKPREYKAGHTYPAVLLVHGGPELQAKYDFDGWVQYLAQSGYLVLEPNYRGSTGYGAKFRALNAETVEAEIDDVSMGVDFMIHEGLADPKRVAIVGASHGGTIVAQAIVKHPDLFAAAIELYGVVNRATYVERTNPGAARRWTLLMGGTPEEKPEAYRRANVLPEVAKIKTPLLIMHGENDHVIPPFESIQFAHALKSAGKTFFYFTYPNEGHGFSQREHILDSWKKQLAFLQKYIQPRYGLNSSATDDLMVPN